MRLRASCRHMKTYACLQDIMREAEDKAPRLRRLALECYVYIMHDSHRVPVFIDTSNVHGTILAHQEKGLARCILSAEDGETLLRFVGPAWAKQHVRNLYNAWKS